MLVLGWIVFGLVAGMIAKSLMPGRDRGGIWTSMVLGIGGAVLGGLLGRALFYWGGRAGSGGVIREPAPFLELSLAVGGAVLALAVYRFISSKRMDV
jgi:uncharacterized membrane protein YeaQ/YmgE (transglycosylase-associated protein family)